MNANSENNDDKEPATILWDLDMISGTLFSLIGTQAIALSLNRNLYIVEMQYFRNSFHL